MSACRVVNPSRLGFEDPLPAIRSFRQQAVVGCWRGLLFICLFSLIWLAEFRSDGSGETNWLYSKAISGFRFIDLLIAGMVVIHLMLWVCIRGRCVLPPRSLVLPGLGFLACIGFAVVRGIAHGGVNVFFDWRALALSIGLYTVWAFWMQRPDEIRWAVRLFGIYMGGRIAVLYLLFALGHRNSILGISIPEFDGPTLSSIAFAALLGFSQRGIEEQDRGKLLWTLLAISAGVMILICFRRTYWGELAIGMAILLGLRRRHRLRKFVAIAALIGCIGLALGRPIAERLASLDVARDDGPLAADNSDHVNDLRDAWDQVQRSPIAGIGLGTSYQTWYIKQWKSESVMVHNAPLHVWLKYGLLGVICYVWFHLALLRLLVRNVREGRSADRGWIEAVFAYLTAQFLMTLGFAPWPYSELQLTTLISFLLAASFAAAARIRKDTLFPA